MFQSVKSFCFLQKKFSFAKKLTEDEVKLCQLRVANFLVHGIAVVSVGVGAKSGLVQPLLHTLCVIVECRPDWDNHGLPWAKPNRPLA